MEKVQDSELRILRLLLLLIGLSTFLCFSFFITKQDCNNTLWLCDIGWYISYLP